MRNLLVKAKGLMEKGMDDQAAQVLQDVLQRNPTAVGATGLLSILYERKGMLDISEKLWRQALQYADTPIAKNGLGNVLFKMKRYGEAEKAFTSAVSIEPDFSPAFFNLGRLHKHQGDIDRAIHFFLDALRYAPQHIPALNNLGNCYQQKGQYEQALECYTKALQIKPDLVEAHLNIGHLFRGKNRKQEAREKYELVLRLQPENVSALGQLGLLYFESDDLVAAESHLRQATSLDPADIENLFSLAVLLQAQGRLDEAIRLLRRTLRLQPDLVKAHLALGSIYLDRGAASTARNYFLKCYRLDRNNAGACYNLGVVAEAEKKQEEALKWFGKAKKLNNNIALQTLYQIANLRIRLGHWHEYDESVAELIRKTDAYLKSTLLLSLPDLVLNYFPLPPHYFKEVAMRGARKTDKQLAPIRKALNFSYRATVGERIKIGYMSPDFRSHAVGILVADLFACHNRKKFQVHAYSLVDSRDAYTDRIRRGCSRFVDISRMSLEYAAKKIYDDGIDVLVDLAGYTTFSRPSILALRPAPVQAQFLGFPGTMGAEYVQYILADRWLIPDEHADRYTEKVIRIPHAFPASAIEIDNREMSRKAYGLPTDAFVFCCFNSIYKIDPHLFSIWCSILRDVSSSVLWLSATDKKVMSVLCSEANRHGIAEERIIFAPKDPMPTYLARYQLANLFLDTYYYSAGSTAVCAMQAGIPMLTVTGETNASRMGASILASAGLDEMICSDLKEYASQAVRFGRHPDLLEPVREKLIHQEDSPLFDLKGFTRNLEKALVRMSDRYYAGNKPQSFEIQ